MQQRPFVVLAAVLGIACLATGLTAQIQILSGETFPNPAVAGNTVNLTLEATIPVYLQSGCGVKKVHQGSPAGPVVYQPFICPFILINVGPGAPATVQWPGTDNSGNPVSPGTYYLEIGYRDQATSTLQPLAFFPVRVVAPGPSTEPVLDTTSPTNMGTSLGLSINAPANANDFYVVMASLTTNVGLPLGPFGHLALDQDILFNLSFPNPDPALFTNFQGILDGNGQTTAPSMYLPVVPALQYSNIAFHAAILGSNTVILTNPISRTLH